MKPRGSRKGSSGKRAEGPRVPTLNLTLFSGDLMNAVRDPRSIDIPMRQVALAYINKDSPRGFYKGYSADDVVDGLLAFLRRNRSCMRGFLENRRTNHHDRHEVESMHWTTAYRRLLGVNDDNVRQPAIDAVLECIRCVAHAAGARRVFLGIDETDFTTTSNTLFHHNDRPVSKSGLRARKSKKAQSLEKEMKRRDIKPDPFKHGDWHAHEVPILFVRLDTGHEFILDSYYGGRTRDAEPDKILEAFEPTIALLKERLKIPIEYLDVDKRWDNDDSVRRFQAWKSKFHFTTNFAAAAERGQEPAVHARGRGSTRRSTRASRRRQRQKEAGKIPMSRRALVAHAFLKATPLAGNRFVYVHDGRLFTSEYLLTKGRLAFEFFPKAGVVIKPGDSLVLGVNMSFRMIGTTASPELGESNVDFALRIMRQYKVRWRDEEEIKKLKAMHPRSGSGAGMRTRMIVLALATVLKATATALGVLRARLHGDNLERAKDLIEEIQDRIIHSLVSASDARLASYWGPPPPDRA